MRVIGLTGGIACGKSTVSDWLRARPDCRVIDGDLLSRELTGPGGAALPEIRAAFGDAVFFSDGALNRRRLGRMVFAQPEARQTLDDLMAPLLRELTLSRLREARLDGVTLCFLDFPLLFEKEYDSLCDTVWCVYLPRPLQLKRLMARDRCTEEEALQRMDAVLSSEEKAARSQVVIDNSGEVSFTLSLLPALLAAEREAAAQAPETGRRRRTGQGASGSSGEAGYPANSRSFPVPRVDPEESGNARRRGSPASTDSAGSPAAPVPDDPDSAPSVMERPAAARRKASSRKAPWRLPVWMITLLAVTGFLVAGSFTAQALMQAYLTRQTEKHAAEERAIYANYPLLYRDLIESTATSYGLNPAYVAAIIRNESSFQPMAVSSVGARGLMQLMPETAEWIAGKLKFDHYAFDRMYDPESNILFGCWYLNYLSGLFRGDPVCVTCAYHAGQGQVQAWLSDASLSQDGVTLNLEKLNEGPTKTYAGRVIRSYGIYQALYFESDLPADSGADAALDGSLGQ